MGKEPAEQSLHSGHRDRMRAKFLQQGLEGFQEHEMLELTLFYALPRVNIPTRLRIGFCSGSALWQMC